MKFPWLKLSHHFVPSNELLVLVFSALSRQSVAIPITRVNLGRMIAESTTSRQNVFGQQK
jgi:hypothetical protein